VWLVWLVWLGKVRDRVGRNEQTDSRHEGGHEQAEPVESELQ